MDRSLRRTTTAVLCAGVTIAALGTVSAATAATAATAAAVPAPAAGVPAAAAAKPVATRAITTATVATYNICRPSACTGVPYSRRFAAAVRTIAAAKPGILAVQEIDDYDGTMLKLVAALRPLGYEPAVTPLEVPKYPRNRTPIGCTPYCGNHLFYRTDSFAPVTDEQGAPRSGYVPMTRVTPAGTWSQVKDRPFAYALLRNQATGGQVLATSVHLPQRSAGASAAFQAASDTARTRAAVGIAQWSQAYLAAAGTPTAATAIMGDFNSYQRRWPNGPQGQLQRLGYRNAEQALRVVNPRYATVNLTAPGTAGIPRKPVVYANGGPRIDSIMVRNVAQVDRHEVVVHLNRAGRFLPRYLGSDHNLVRVLLRF